MNLTYNRHKNQVSTRVLISQLFDQRTVLHIVVINVRKKIKNVNKRVFYEKNKKRL